MNISWRKKKQWRNIKSLGKTLPRNYVGLNRMCSLLDLLVTKHVVVWPFRAPTWLHALPAQNHSQLATDRKNVKPAVCQKGVRAWDEYENKMAERAAEIMWKFLPFKTKNSLIRKTCKTRMAFPLQGGQGGYACKRWWTISMRSFSNIPGIATFSVRVLPNLVPIIYLHLHALCDYWLDDIFGIDT